METHITCQICNQILTTPISLCQYHHVDLVCALKSRNGYICPDHLCRTSLPQTHAQLLKFGFTSHAKLESMEKHIDPSYLNIWENSCYEMDDVLKQLRSNSRVMEQQLSPF
jgi:hypothetical protein